MVFVEGVVTEIRQDVTGNRPVGIRCPADAIPAPGQYLLADDPAADSALGVAVFAGESTPEGFLALPSVPVPWQPGVRLHLRGPLGHGFRLPQGIRRLALAALGETAARLSPLALQAVADGMEVALFTSAPLPALPAAVEAYPESDLPANLPWADWLALDLPLHRLAGLRSALGLGPEGHLSCPAQALILTPMPCGGLADCGVCSAPARRGWKLACKDGPVFDLSELEW